MSDSDSSYESVEEEEFAPAASAKSRAAPPSGLDPAARSGSGSPPRAASSGHRGRPETRSVAPVRRDVTESWSPAAKGKGKGKGWTQSFRHCPHCWQRTSTFSSAVQQHEYWNYICLRWQRYNRGGITWEEAGEGAQRQKDRRERRHQQSMYSRALSAPAEYEMKEKKDRKRRPREKKRRTPSPVIKRERRRPPSNDSRDGCEPRIVRRRDGEYLMMKLKSK